MPSRPAASNGDAVPRHVAKPCPQDGAPQLNEHVSPWTRGTGAAASAGDSWAAGAAPTSGRHVRRVRLATGRSRVAAAAARDAVGPASMWRAAAGAVAELRPADRAAANALRFAGDPRMAGHWFADAAESGSHSLSAHPPPVGDGGAEVGDSERLELALRVSVGEGEAERVARRDGVPVGVREGVSETEREGPREGEPVRVVCTVGVGPPLHTPNSCATPPQLTVSVVIVSSR